MISDLTNPYEDDSDSLPSILGKKDPPFAKVLHHIKTAFSRGSCICPTKEKNAGADDNVNHFPSDVQMEYTRIREIDVLNENDNEGAAPPCASVRLTSAVVIADLAMLFSAASSDNADSITMHICLVICLALASSMVVLNPSAVQQLLKRHMMNTKRIASPKHRQMYDTTVSFDGVDAEPQDDTHGEHDTHDERDTNAFKTIDEYKDDLPDPSEWLDRPIFIQAMEGTNLIGTDHVRLGLPTEFETPLFKGKCLFRLKSIEPGFNNAAQESYFSHPNTRKMVIQIAIQGQFKEPLYMSEVYYGCNFEKPFQPRPPKWASDIIKSVFSRFVPGLILDLYSDTPTALCRIGSGCHTMSIDTPGSEPDLIAADLPERTMYSSDVLSSSKRKRELAKDHKDSKHTFNPDLIYTFNNSDQNLELGNYDIILPIGKFSMVRFLNHQPLGVTAVTEDGRVLYGFKIWHELLVK